MVEIIPYRSDTKSTKLNSIILRNSDFDPKLESSVQSIINAVRERGDEAIIEFTRKFDRVNLTANDFRVQESEIECAYRNTDSCLIKTIETAAANIRRFHEAQVRTSWFVEDGDGVILGKRVLPIEHVALLIPGASAPLFSTLLMAAIPAMIARVPHLCLATPPQPDSSVHPTILAAAHIVGIREIYKIFGAQAVAAFAYGTKTLPRVDKLIGPGHPAVQIAKKKVFGTVDIDMVAGPSEILVLADDSANPQYIAADLLSQAEHGTGLEIAICITPSPKLAKLVASEIESQAVKLTNRTTIEKTLDHFGAIVIVQNLDEGIKLANQIAPEHLELMVKNPWTHLDSIRNAGAIFLGPDSSEPVGDYYAGTNHILPTAGTSRFASSVGVETFLKTISLVSYTNRRLQNTADDIVQLAEAEGLEAHANAIRIRQLKE